MDYSSIITSIGISIIIIYCVKQLMTFYGINTSSYGTYLAFYIFLLITVFLISV